VYVDSYIAKCWGFLGRGISESGAFYGGASIERRLLNGFRLAFLAVCIFTSVFMMFVGQLIVCH